MLESVSRIGKEKAPDDESVGTCTASLAGDCINSIWERQTSKPYTKKNNVLDWHRLSEKEQQFFLKQEEMEKQIKTEFDDLMQVLCDEHGVNSKDASDEELKKIKVFTSCFKKLRETQFNSENLLQMMQTITKSVEQFKAPESQFVPDKKQVNEQARNEWTHKYLNQMFMSTKDDFVKTKYFDFIRENKIEIVSDIFERMEIDRKLKDLQNKQQKMDA